MFPALRFIMLLAVSVAAAGCGRSDLIKLNGRVVQNGQAVSAGSKEALRVSFHKFKDGKEVNLFTARMNEQDGTFQVIGPEKKGIPPGSYRISVVWSDIPKKKDKLQGAFKLEKTPFKFEIDKNTPEIILDIGSGKRG